MCPVTLLMIHLCNVRLDLCVSCVYDSYACMSYVVVHMLAMSTLDVACMKIECDDSP